MKPIRYLLVMGLLLQSVSLSGAKKRTKSAKNRDCPVAQYSMAYQCGTFHMHPYPEKFAQLPATSRFEPLDCYVLLSNKTRYTLKVTFFHYKDTPHYSSLLVPVPDGKLEACKVPPYMITGFALPRIKWCDPMGTGGAGPGHAKIVQVLKSAPIVGFAITRLHDSVPTTAQYMLVQERKNMPTYFLDISTHVNGEIKITESSPYLT